jgi:hypothetical protein
VPHAVDREHHRIPCRQHARQRDDRRFRAIVILLSRCELDRAGQRAVAAPRPPKPLEMGARSERLSEVVRERSDVKAGGAIQHHGHSVLVDADKIKSENGYLSLIRQ